MNDRAATRRSYDTVAQDYLDQLGDELAGKPLDRAVLAAFAELTGPGPVADIGCGPGHVAAHLAGLGLTVAGFDLAPGMCALARRTTGLPVAAADAIRLPLRSGCLAGLVCLYTVIHLDGSERVVAYREFARVLAPGGIALVTFHVSDDGTAAGGTAHLQELLGRPVDLAFRYLDPDGEAALLADTGLQPLARLDRAPHGDEHPSTRAGLLYRKSTSQIAT